MININKKRSKEIYLKKKKSILLAVGLLLKPRAGNKCCFQLSENVCVYILEALFWVHSIGFHVCFLAE